MQGKLCDLHLRHMQRSPYSSSVYWGLCKAFMFHSLECGCFGVSCRTVILSHFGTISFSAHIWSVLSPSLETDTFHVTQETV